MKRSGRNRRRRWSSTARNPAANTDDSHRRGVGRRPGHHRRCGQHRSSCGQHHRLRRYGAAARQQMGGGCSRRWRRDWSGSRSYIPTSRTIPTLGAERISLRSKEASPPNEWDRAHSRRSTQSTPTRLEAILHRPRINPPELPPGLSVGKRLSRPAGSQGITFLAFLLQTEDARVSEPWNKMLTGHY